MSNQRPEESYDPSFNYKNFMPQNMGYPNFQGNMVDLDQQNFQNTISGKYNQAATQQQQETFRNPAMSQQTIGNVGGVQNFGVLGQFSGLPGQSKTLDQNLLGRLPQKDLPLNLQSGINLDPTANQFGKNTSQFDQFNMQNPLFQNNLALQQQQFLQLELLKMQQTPSSQNLLLQNQLHAANSGNPGLFGAGFLNAAQLLASAQQLSQPPQPQQMQPPTLSMQDKSPSQGQIGGTPSTALNQNPANNFMNNIYSNLNHYQTLIDSIEKGGALGTAGLTQQNFGQGMNQQKTPLSQQTQSYLNATGNFQTPTLSGYAGYNQSELLQQNQAAKPLQQNYMKQNNYLGAGQDQLADLNNQSMSGYLINMNGNENNEPLSTTKNNNQYGQQNTTSPYNNNYDAKSQSRERLQQQYNPSQYQNYNQQQQQQQNNNNNRSFSSDYNYAKTLSQAKQQQHASDNTQANANSGGGISWLSGPKKIEEGSDYKQTEHYIQKSPSKNHSQAKGRENQSPSSLYRNNYNNDEQINESFNYLKFQNQNKQQQPKQSNQNSPKQQQNKNFLNYDHNENMGNGYDYLQQSFRNNQQHNNSQGSNSILQEQHLNTYQNRHNTHNSNNQYSPQDSQYKNSNNDNYYENQHQTSFQMRSNRGVMNIDDMPIHAPKAKNFEELLESNLREMGIDPTPINDDEDNSNTRQKPKREFLRRKSKKAEVSVPPQSKKYEYYADNFDGDRKKEEDVDIKKEPRKGSYIQQQKNQKNDDANFDDKPIGGSRPAQRQNHHHEDNTTKSSNYNNEPTSTNKKFNKNMQEDDNGVTDRNDNKPKKKFLQRGQGTAGGRKGYDKSKSRQGIEQEEAMLPQQQQPQSTNKNQNRTTMKSQQQKKTPNPLSDDDYNNDYQDNSTLNRNKSPRPQNTSHQNKLPSTNNTNNTSAYNTQQQQQQHLARNSIMEFEKLEKECNDKYSPSPNNNNVHDYTKKNAGQNNKRKKKLFDDSESDNNDDEADQQQNTNNIQNHDDENERMRQYQSGNDAIVNNQQQEDAPKSNIVKKYFMKEDSKIPNVSTKSSNSNLQQTANSAVSEEMERIVQQKVDQLNKAMEKFNQEQEFHNRKRQEYEKIIQKAQVEKREFEGMKKKAFEEIERLKQDELEKMKKEKKALEQRSKNLQLVGSSNKKEREEIDGLKKELLRVVEESKAKEQKQKMTIDRLKKQVDDLTVRNKELSDELKHHEQQRLQQNVQQQNSKSQLKQPSNIINVQSQNQQQQQQQQQQQRYTFSTQGSVSASQEQQLQQQQQPKGILKNKHESQQNVVRGGVVTDQSPPSHIGSGDQDVQYQDDEEIKYDDNNHHEDHDDGQELNNKQQNQEEQSNNAQQPAAEEEEEEDYDMKFPQEYHGRTPSNMRVIEQIIGNDGKIQRVYENGKKEVIFNNGVKREVFPDGYTIVYFNNNDIKQTYPDQKVVYYFADAKTTQTTFPDGLQVFKFANNQVEKHFPDGTKEIIFPDGTIKCIFADGEEESIFPDGTIQRIEKNGVKAIEFANGQKDILFPDGTRIREFPDGKVRKTYPDGTFENTYRQQ